VVFTFPGQIKTRRDAELKQYNIKGKKMGIIERLWRLLPDKCEGRDCKKKGVRGNENVIDGKVYCDDCSIKCWDCGCYGCDGAAC